MCFLKLVFLPIDKAFIQMHNQKRLTLLEVSADVKLIYDHKLGKLKTTYSKHLIKFIIMKLTKIYSSGLFAMLLLFSASSCMTEIVEEVILEPSAEHLALEQADTSDR